MKFLETVRLGHAVETEERFAVSVEREIAMMRVASRLLGVWPAWIRWIELA